jgi:hypothetical protein
MLIIVLQTLQFLLSHPSNVAFLYQTYPQFFLTVSDLSERDTPPNEVPPPSALATPSASAAYVMQQTKKWMTVRELSTNLLNSLAAYTNGDVTPKKPIKRPGITHSCEQATGEGAGAREKGERAQDERELTSMVRFVCSGGAAFGPLHPECGGRHRRRRRRHQQ